jgi:DNA-binding LytR/AlgR family response regulator
MTRAAARLLTWRIGRAGAMEFAGAFLIGLYMASVGAFDSDGVPPVPRYLYWVFAMVGGAVAAALVEVQLWRIAALARRPRLLAVVQTVAMTPPVALVVAMVNFVVYGRLLHPSVWPQFLFSVFIVDIAVVILAVLVRRATARMMPAQEAPSRSGAPAAIAAKLTPRMARADLLAVQAEDHYLRVHTAAGDALILMRFADALDALQACDGVRTHRSWWVARKAVDVTRFSRGRGELQLCNGVTAPVSRTYAGELRNAGWT